MRGIITKIIANQYTVTLDNKEYICTARGKFKNIKQNLLVGDHVDIDIEKNTIENVFKRKNELNRPQVANVDIALIICSIKEPDLSFTLLDKMISIISINKIEPVICFTKLDLCSIDELDNIKNNIANYYESIGIRVFYNNKLNELKKYLNTKIVVLTGQTGAGKSSLLNKLDKTLNLKTQEISKALGRGVHTTRHTSIYNIDSIFFVDTPGFSSIDFYNVTTDELKESFFEFKNYPCKYKDCTHVKEEECNVKKNVLNGNILQSRYDSYLQFRGEIIESSSKLYN